MRIGIIVLGGIGIALGIFGIGIGMGEGFEVVFTGFIAIVLGVGVLLAGLGMPRK